MYIPSIFNEDDPEKIIAILEENSFATLITTDPDGTPIATPLPFLIKQQGSDILLQAHFAKANPQWKQLEKNKRVLVIFNGPHCYISPSNYENAGVPTWDYVSVHVYGTAKLFNDPEQTRELIEELTDKYEQAQEKPWTAKNNYPDKMLDAIVGFEITVQDVQGKVKIGQNKSKADLKGVVQALEQSSSEQELAIASLIKTYLKSKD